MIVKNTAAYHLLGQHLAQPITWSTNLTLWTIEFRLRRVHPHTNPPVDIKPVDLQEDCQVQSGPLTRTAQTTQTIISIRRISLILLIQCYHLVHQTRCIRWGSRHLGKEGVGTSVTLVGTLPYSQSADAWISVRNLSRCTWKKQIDLRGENEQRLIRNQTMPKSCCLMFNSIYDNPHWGIGDVIRR